MPQQPLRILVIGSGMIGSIYATQLQAVGHAVTLLARGQHAADLRAYGLVLEDVSTGQSTTSHLQVVEQLLPEEHYDLNASKMMMRREHVKPDRSKVAPFSPAAANSSRKPTVFMSGRRLVARIVSRFARRGSPAYSWRPRAPACDDFEIPELTLVIQM